MSIESKEINELESIQQEVVQLITKYSLEYNGSNEMYEKLETLYNELYRICDVLTEKKNFPQFDAFYELEKKLPCIFVIDAKPKNFDLNQNILENISLPKESYTLEEAETLIKWTVNNTRKNLTQELERSRNNIENLMGCCGFSQFSSLYPLQKLGLKITINNASSFNGGRHAFGTVTIPIKMGNEIVNKQYLIDCTYSQFYMLPDCVESKYSKDGRRPEAGYFIKDDPDKQQFVANLISDGYCEFNNENMKKYAYGLRLSQCTKEDAIKLKDKICDIDFINIVNNIQEEFDYEEEEFIDWNYNLEISNETNKTK